MMVTSSGFVFIARQKLDDRGRYLCWFLSVYEGSSRGSKLVLPDGIFRITECVLWTSHTVHLDVLSVCHDPVYTGSSSVGAMELSKVGLVLYLSGYVYSNRVSFLHYSHCACDVYAKITTWKKAVYSRYASSLAYSDSLVVVRYGYSGFFLPVNVGKVDLVSIESYRSAFTLPIATSCDTSSISSSFSLGIIYALCSFCLGGLFYFFMNFLLKL